MTDQLSNSIRAAALSLCVSTEALLAFLPQIRDLDSRLKDNTHSHENQEAQDKRHK